MVYNIVKIKERRLINMFDVIGIDKKTNEKIIIKSFFERETAQWYIEEGIKENPFDFIQNCDLIIKQR